MIKKSFGISGITSHDPHDFNNLLVQCSKEKLFLLHILHESCLFNDIQVFEAEDHSKIDEASSLSSDHDSSMKNLA